MAKLQVILKILVDCGFNDYSLSYPYFNVVVKYFSGRIGDVTSQKQFTLGELEYECKVCKLRYTYYVVFNCTTIEHIITGLILYLALAHTTHVYC